MITASGVTKTYSYHDTLFREQVETGGPSISYEQENPPSLRKSMLPANVAVTRKGSWPSETFPMLEKGRQGPHAV